MSMEFQYDVFLSHSQTDKPRVRKLARRLRGAGLRVWLDEWVVKPADHIYLAVEHGLEISRTFVLCVSPAAMESPWVTAESRTALFRDPLNKERRFVMLLLADAVLPDMLSAFAYVDYRQETKVAFQRLLAVCPRTRRPRRTRPVTRKKRTRRLTSAIPAPVIGIVPVDRIRRSASRLPGEVFAIELLQRPIEILRQRDGRFLVAIDRRDVQHAVVTTEAKNQITRQYVAGREDEIRARDNALHDFLLGKSREDRFVVDLPRWGLPLRWASGGVMSVVTRTDRPDEKWTPLFFRDINPWGWNVALGSCEREFDDRWMCRMTVENELQDPRRFLFREFLEETLVLSGRPQGDRPVSFRRFYFDDYLADEQLKKSAEFARKHIRHRTRDDGIKIYAASGRAGGQRPPNTISVHNGIVNMDTLIISPQGEASRHFGFLVVFNLLELGIEVVRAFEYEMGPDDYFLDGELLVHPDGSTELVRMPVALLSHRALKRFLGPASYRPLFTDDQPPAFVGGRMTPDEMQVFDWDIQQRLERMRSSRTLERERRRYERWFERFGARLLTRDGKFRCGAEPQVFTPAAAKVLSLYFAQTP